MSTQKEPLVFNFTGKVIWFKGPNDKVPIKIEPDERVLTGYWVEREVYVDRDGAPCIDAPRFFLNLKSGDKTFWVPDHSIVLLEEDVAVFISGRDIDWVLNKREVFGGYNVKMRVPDYLKHGTPNKGEVAYADRYISY